MKIFAGIALAAISLVGTASATTVYVAATCGSFTNSNQNSTPISGSWVCPTAASLSLGATPTAEFLLYNSDYSSGITSNVTAVGTFTFSGGGTTLQWNNDTVTSTGTSNSNPGTDSQGQTINPLTFTAFGVSGPVLLAGFYDSATGGVLGNAITVNYTDQFTVGAAVAGTGYAEVVYSYTSTSGTPEPVSMVLFGSGLLAVSLIGRKKLLGRK